ncbi:MAG TPA: SDR family NAD(P)-dependent oxidoreductase [Candidatus Saccharimonadales bacterium]|nr:SDR family NAD(P)-dependent oxidoreductase [Candidatus Saccharimonadales bacterium]
MIVITGASDGLGLEVAKLYKAAGKTVVNVSRHESKYADVNLLHDLRKGSEITAAANEIMALKEPLEVLINCAGVYTNEPLGQITEEEIKRNMATHVKAPILLVSTMIDRIKRDGTDVANVVSAVATKANPNEAVYGASKWALRGFTQNLQLELKDTSCRVIGFYPGGFGTDLFLKATGKDVDREKFMRAADVALCLKQLLDLPRNIEISEIILNRKNPK